MTRKKKEKNKLRVRRDTEDRLSSCEFHLLTLWEAKQKADKQPERFKQISGVLRVLVCRKGQNKPLLLDLMKEFGIEGRANPLGGRILLIGWKKSQEYIDAYNKMENPPTDPDELIDALHKVMPPGGPIMFEDYIENGCAIGNENGEYSYKDLILALSQQKGSSHEDCTIDKLLSEVSKPRENGEPLFMQPLLTVSHKVLGLGAVMFMELVRTQKYKTKYLTVDFFNQYGKAKWQVSYPV